MAEGLLSLKWNHHRSTFIHVLSTIRSKESYSDVTLACDGKFYPVHKLVLSTCSEYFEQIFDRTSCKHPVVVLKDIDCSDLEALLNYMYIGEVNVLQDKLASLIKAAEGLRIKGLAVPDEDPYSRESGHGKRGVQGSDDSHVPKKRRKDDQDAYREEQQPRRRREASVDSDRRLSAGQDSDVAESPRRESNSHGVNRNKSSSSSVTVPKSSPDSVAASRVQDNAQDDEVLIDEQAVKEEPPDSYTDQPPEEQDSKDFYLTTNIEEFDHEELSPDGGRNSNMSDNKSPMRNPSTSSGAWEDGVSGPSQSESSTGVCEDKDANHPPVNLSLRQDLVKKRTHSSSDNEVSNADGVSHKPRVPGGFMCPYCDRVLASRPSYNYHVRTHTGEKAYQCHLCSYKCIQKSQLSSHMRKHNHSGPYPCPLCHQQFIHWSDLQDHVNATHKQHE